MIAEQRPSPKRVAWPSRPRLFHSPPAIIHPGNVSFPTAIGAALTASTFRIPAEAMGIPPGTQTYPSRNELAKEIPGTLKAVAAVALQKWLSDRIALLCSSRQSVLRPRASLMNRTSPTTSPLGNHLTWPFRIMCTTS